MAGTEEPVRSPISRIASLIKTMVDMFSMQNLVVSKKSDLKLLRISYVNPVPGTWSVDCYRSISLLINYYFKMSDSEWLIQVLTL